MKKLNNDAPQIVYSSPDIYFCVDVIKKMSWKWNTQKKSIIHKNYTRKPEGTRLLWIESRNAFYRVWTRFIWLRIKSSGRLLWRIFPFCCSGPNSVLRNFESSLRTFERCGRVLVSLRVQYCCIEGNSLPGYKLVMIHIVEEIELLPLPSNHLFMTSRITIVG
jgi:hypothetical protein